MSMSAITSSFSLKSTNVCLVMMRCVSTKFKKFKSPWANHPIISHIPRQCCLSILVHLRRYDSRFGDVFAGDYAYRSNFSNTELTNCMGSVRHRVHKRSHDIGHEAYSLGHTPHHTMIAPSKLPTLTNEHPNCHNASSPNPQTIYHLCDLGHY